MDIQFQEGNLHPGDVQEHVYDNVSIYLFNVYI